MVPVAGFASDSVSSSTALVLHPLGISSRTGRLMCYYILTSNCTVVSRSTVQRLTDLELQTDAVKSVFDNLDEIWIMANKEVQQKNNLETL